jgi:hypothetical protein
MTPADTYQLHWKHLKFGDFAETLPPPGIRNGISLIRRNAQDGYKPTSDGIDR